MPTYTWAPEPEETPGADFRAFVGLDPAASWFFLVASEDFLGVNMDGPGPIPFLLQLNNKQALKAFNAVRRGSLAVQERIHIFSFKKPFVAVMGQPFVAYAWPAFFEKVEEANEKIYAKFKKAKKIIKLSATLSRDSWVYDDTTTEADFPQRKPPPVSTYNPVGAQSPAVIMAVIDDGIAVANHRFRRADDTTRVEYFWHMGMRPVSNSRSVPYGREFAKGEIDGWIVASGGDDLQAHRNLGIFDLRRDRRDSLARRHAHGTHVLDLLAGAEPEQDVANRPIIAVQLPPEVVEDSSGAQIEAHLGAALDYIRERARLISASAGGDPIPVVVNVSYGFTAGPHDGTSLIERLMDQALKAGDPPLNIVLSAGNAHLSRCHATVPPHRNGEQSVGWRLQPGDRTQSDLQIWLPALKPGPDGKDVRLEVTAPGGAEASIDPIAGRAFLLQYVNGPGQTVSVARLSYARDPASGRGVFLLRTMPTRRGLHETTADRNGVPLHDKVAPSGLWTLNLKVGERITAEAPVQIWVQRDDTIPGYPEAGRQSFLDDPRYPLTDIAPVPPDRFPSDLDVGVALTAVDPDCPVRRASLMNAIATGGETIVVGAYERAGLTLLPFSAGGPEAPLTAVQRAPDAVAPASDSYGHFGRLAAGTRSGSWVAMGGTSVAAPLAGRRMATLFILSVPTYGPSIPWNRTGFEHAVATDEATLPTGKPLVERQRAFKGRMTDPLPASFPPGSFPPDRRMQRR